MDRHSLVDFGMPLSQEKTGFYFNMDVNLSKRRKNMIDIVITLLPLICMSIYFYGMRVVVMLAFAMLLSIGMDFVGNLLLGRKRPEKYDFSAIVTAIIFTLMLPATAPYWMIAVGIFLAVFVAKVPFGGFEKNIFNPAAFAAAFMIISWPQYMVQYPAVFADIGLGSAADVLTTNSADYILQMGGAPKITFTDALLGNFSGPMGTTCILVMCACALYLLVRGTISWQLPLGAFSVVLFFALCFPRVTTGWLASVVYELVSGVLFFGIIFMASDPTTTPKTAAGKLMFGLMLGLITMLFRRFGKAECSFVFALLLMNALSEFCDVIGNEIYRKIKPNKQSAIRSGGEAA